MPWNKDGSRKTSPLYKESGFKMKGSPMQRKFGIKPSPVKWAFLVPVAKAVIGAVASKAMTKKKKEIPKII